jgi:DNA-binding response OmpR family regulator
MPHKVLVVEDEYLLALDLEQELHKAGFLVAGPALSVAEALPLAQFGCDAAVLDVNLAGETAEPIAEALLARRTPFLTVTGYAAGQRPAVFESVPCLGKPVRSEALIGELRKMLAAGA